MVSQGHIAHCLLILMSRMGSLRTNGSAGKHGQGHKTAISYTNLDRSAARWFRPKNTGQDLAGDIHWVGQGLGTELSFSAQSQEALPQKVSEGEYPSART